MSRVLMQPDPDVPEPAKHAQYGLVALHKRFLRRASYLLLGSPDYHDAIDAARQEWNQAHPCYAVCPGTTLSDCGLPQRLADDAANELAAFTQLGVDARAYRQRGEQVPPALHERSLAHLESPPLTARIAWHVIVDSLARQFWPADDFPTPGAGAHPATEFVRACLVSDLVTIQPDGYLEMPRLDVVSLPQPINGAEWCIPVHPGMTADDLREAADRLARDVGRAYAFTLPTDRIRDLRASGLTLQAIADQLGINESTVRSIVSV